MTSAIIVAAGNSQRMGFDKLLARLGNAPVIAHTIEAFDACEEIGEIIIIANDARIEVIRALVPACNFEKITHIVEGGAQRHDSVWAGLKKVNPQSDQIAVHDGARPLITPEQITRCIESAKKHRAATSAHPITDTVKRANAAGQVTVPVDRENLWAMETPQVFERNLLIDSYQKIIAEGKLVTDEVSAINAPVQLVPNDTPNPKITFPADLATAEKLLD